MLNLVFQKKTVYTSGVKRIQRSDNTEIMTNNQIKVRR